MDKRMRHGALSSILALSMLSACNGDTPGDDEFNEPTEPEVEASDEMPNADDMKS